MKPSRTALLFALAAGLACHRAAPPVRQRPPPAVTTALVTVRDVPVEIRSPVDLKPIEQADVGAKAIGYLDAVLVDRGDHVRKGQLLAVVRPSDLSDQLDSSRGALAQAEAQALLARANLDRSEKLAPTGFVSQQDLQSQQTALKSSEAALEAARANVGVMATRLGETRIDSPLDGYVSVRKLDPGALVGPGAPTGTIVTIQRLDVLRVFVPVNEREVAQLRLGEDAHVEVDALPGQSFRGKVVRLSPSFDPGARTLDAEVHLPNPGGVLRPGMYGRASIVTGIHRSSVVIPSATIQISDGKPYAFVLDGAAPPQDPKLPAALPAEEKGQPQPLVSKVRRVLLQTGVDGGDWMEIASGLKPGSEIVTAGMDALSDGVQVRAYRNIDAFTGKPLTADAE